MNLMGKDDLKEVHDGKLGQSLYEFQPSYSSSFNKYFVKKYEKYDFEYFGLSLFHRGIACMVSVLLSLCFFFIAITRILKAVYSPSSFVFPYALSNVFFLFALSFFFGFKTNFRRMFSHDKRPFTIAFLASTLITFYAAFFSHGYFLNLALMFLQVVCSICFVIALFPWGGAAGLSTMFSMFFKK